MPTTTSLTPTDLTTFTAYAGLPADTVAWLLAHGPGCTYAAGETIFEPGTPAEPMAAVLRGGIQFCAQQGGQREPVFRVEAGQVAGGLPYSRLHEIKNPGVAAGETVLYLMHHDLFTALEDSSPELCSGWWPS